MIPHIVWNKKKGVGKIATDKLLDEVLPLLLKKKYSAKPLGSYVGAWQTQPVDSGELTEIEGKIITKPCSERILILMAYFGWK